MMDPHDRAPGASLGRAGGQSLQRLQLEMALDSRNDGRRPHAVVLAEAAEAAGADLLFVLPGASGLGLVAVVRVSEDGIDSFLQISIGENGIAVSEQPEMDPHLLRLARASVDVLERLSDDDNIRMPLAAAE